MAAHRYWRLVGIEARNYGDLELSAVQLYDLAGRIATAHTLSATATPISGAVANLETDDLTEAARFAAKDVYAGGFALVFDFGSAAVEPAAVRLGSSFSRDRFLSLCTLQGSDDGFYWVTQASFGRYVFPGAQTLTTEPNVTVPGDPLFPTVTALVHFDTLTGGALADVAGGSWSTAGALSETSRFGKALSCYGAFTSRPAGSQFQFGSGDFTVECWVYQTSRTGGGAVFGGIHYQNLIGQNQIGTPDNSTFDLVLANGGLCADAFTSSLNYGMIVSTPIPLNTWVHAAYVRSGNTFLLFQDGVQIASANYAITVNVSSRVCAIGCDSTGSAQLQGLIDEVRISKTARYTANFTPPDRAFPDTQYGSGGAVGDDKFASVISLLPFSSVPDGFADTKGVAWAAQGNAYVASAPAKFAAAGQFDGSGDYLSAVAPLNFGTGDFTVEGWAYLSAYSYGALLSTYTTGAGGTVNGLQLGFNNVGKAVATVGVAISPAYVDEIFDADTTALNTWVHLAMSRASGVLRLFVGGALKGSVSSTRSITLTAAVVGRLYADADANYLNGAIGGVRASNIARYTEAFTPPAAQFPTSAGSVASDPDYASVTLLLHGDATPDGLQAVDNGSVPKVMNLRRGAISSATKSKWGPTALYFPGSGGSFAYLTPHADLDFGAGDLTIEFWLFLEAAPAASARLFQSRNGDVVPGMYLSGDGSGGLQFYYSTNGASFVGSGLIFTPPVGAWSHIAITRSGGIFTAWKDGVSQGDYGAPGAVYFNIADNWVFGGQDAPNPRPVQGYVDDLRFTKGKARYTGPFTPPAAQFPDTAAVSGPDIYEANPIKTRRPVAPLRTATGYAEIVGNGGHLIEDIDFADMEFGGPGIIRGTVKKQNDPDNLPLRRRVRLVYQRSGLSVRETWSDEIAGAYAFRGLRMGEKYIVYSLDHTMAYNAVIADNQVPEAA